MVLIGETVDMSKYSLIFNDSSFSLSLSQFKLSILNPASPEILIPLFFEEMFGLRSNISAVSLNDKFQLEAAGYMTGSKVFSWLGPSQH